jgi:hypothetical protein
MPKPSRFTVLPVLAVTLLGASGAMAQDRTPPRDPPGQASRWTERFMELYDHNRDGKVTLDEIGGDQKRVFGAIDSNGDGSVSVEEFRRRAHVLELFSTTSLFDLLDANGDGKLSADEIGAPSKRWFTRYDANRDGAMEANEIPDRGRGHGRNR